MNDFNEINIRFGENISRLRKREKFSRKDIAELLGVTEMAVGTYERGIRTPSLDKILKLADFFNVSVDSLLRIDNADSNKTSLVTNGDKLYLAIPADKRDEYFRALPYAAEIINNTIRAVEEKSSETNVATTA